MIHSRRDFLNRSGGLAAILAASSAPAILRAEPKKPAGKLGVALIGLGGFSSGSIAPEIAATENVWFAGAVTGDPEGKGRAWAAEHGFPEKNLYRYDQIERLKDNPDIDFVHVVTPNGLHAEHCIAAAKAGKHVICEKPMATTAADCEAIIAACKEAGVLLATSYRLHWEPHHLKMMELAKDPEIGSVQSIFTEFSWTRGDQKPWLLDKTLAGGGAFFDTGVYPVQAGCYVTGEAPVRVSALPTTVRDVYPSGVEEIMTATFEYPGGAVMTARSSYRSRHQIFEVATERQTFACLGDKGSVFGQSGGGKPNGKKVRLPNGEIFKARDTLQLATLHDAFARAILNGEKEFKTPGEMGLRDVRIVEAVYASAADGGRAVEVKV